MSDSHDTSRQGPVRSRSNFLARTATDTAAQLSRRTSAEPDSLDGTKSSDQAHIPHSEETNNPYEPATNASTPPPRQFELTRKLINFRDEDHHDSTARRRSAASRRTSGKGWPLLGNSSLMAQMHNEAETKTKRDGTPINPRAGAMPRPIGGSDKLGTFSGVFVPTSLNVLSILMFLRFGFILGQTGVIGMMGMLIASYLINLVTTLSISAIATNGTVRGGGAYYLISRSLGPEFGGSIGVVFYLGFVFNTGLNAVGLIDCLKQNFGEQSGSWYNWLPEGWWWEYLWASLVLLVCTAICLAGSSIFARASNGLLAVLLVATFSIPFSALLLGPFESRRLGIEYTGLSLTTFKNNLLPRLTRGAAGSQIHGKESFQDLFGILFPATGGIFAGASMSGDLKHPSKAIPKGTLSGLALTFFAYTIVIMAMAATITRASFYRNVNIIQDTNISEVLILLGEFATAFFSSLMGVIGSAKLLQALARDNLLPGVGIFGQGTRKGDEPTYGILITHVVAQLTMLCDINQIASFVTMTYLMTFLVTNLACFLLKISSAPNFRPSFHYFNSWTAGAGAIISGAMMFFVDGLYATGCVGILVVIFLLIHYTSAPKSWGDVSQSLIYHQVRKYLLRLRQEHVKFWRPQILLLVNDPRRQYKLIQFCNSMKKGGLYILAHVIVSQDFGAAVPEARRQQAAWTKYIDFSKVKAFVNIAISPVVEWGTRDIVLSSGLGGMRPNIAVMGFYNLDEHRQQQPLIDVSEPRTSAPSETAKSSADQAIGVRGKGPKKSRRDSTVRRLEGLLPTDTCRTEAAMTASSYVTILEDLLLRLQINVALAKGFRELELPSRDARHKRFIDLWPIQMSAEIAGEGDSSVNVLTTNFDTYTLILQLGCILDTVPSWRRTHNLRIAVFVEYESDVDEERGRVKALLDNLRIRADILVFWLASGDLKTYEHIVNGISAELNVEREIDEALKDDHWWREVQKMRGKGVQPTAAESLSGMNSGPSWRRASFSDSPGVKHVAKLRTLKKLFRKSGAKHTMNNAAAKLGVNLGMTTHRLDPNLVQYHATQASASEDDGSSGDDSDTVGTADTGTGGEDADDESSGGERSVASEGDLEGDASGRPQHPVPPRRRSDGDDMLSQSTPKRAVPSRLTRSDEPETSTPIPSEQTPTRPSTTRQSSMARFTSKPVPMTTVATEDGPGPSIMFTDTPTPRSKAKRVGPSSPSHRPSIYARRTSSQDPTNSAADRNLKASKRSPSIQSSDSRSGRLESQALPLSFNDLPCRAQHLILNELMKKHSIPPNGSSAATNDHHDSPTHTEPTKGDESPSTPPTKTDVLFTTLPSPLAGTGQSEEASLSYLADLEVLCKGLPPVLLVHSNSMTVTMNL
ncbi:MAG: hypothetical protein M1817_003629 [Caeruleum heppii]|nr:MAG: hypothetical protein M1817_003629 [Caeruleum heppii]